MANEGLSTRRGVRAAWAGVTACALVVGMIVASPVAAPPAEAAYSATGVIVDTGGWRDATPLGIALSQPMTPVDNRSLYGSTYTSGGTVFTFARDGETARPDNQVLIANGVRTNDLSSSSLSTMAIDADPYGKRGAKYAYFWSWASTNDISTAEATQLGLTSNPSGYAPVFRVAQDTTKVEVLLVPRSNTLGWDQGYSYWSGGEVIQGTGEIVFGDGECDTLAGGYSMLILDPVTGMYNFSGKIAPATPSDAIFGTNTGLSCDGLGYVASDFALDANGNAYLQVRSNQAAPAFGLPAANREWIVRVVPSTTGDWTYNLVTPLVAAPGQAAAAADFANGGTGNYGSAFYQGSLYVTMGTNLLRVNPMSGYVYVIPPGSAAPPAMGPVQSYVQDLASGQTADVIQGRVFLDTNANGAIEAGERAGQSGLTVALYMLDSSGTFVYQGQRTTDGSGNYSFLVGGAGDYLVRLVQPAVGGVNAVQTYANGGGDLNPVIAHCANGDVTSASGGVCVGALAQPAPDPALPAAAAAAGTDTTTQPATMAIYSTVTITSDQEVADADFGITVTGSFGDAAAGPATLPAAPVHVNGVAPAVWLGSTLGAYAGPATDNAAHDATDDGVTIDSYTGRLPLAGTLLAGTRTYQLSADVSGPQANSPLVTVTGWTTGAGNSTWGTTPAWTPVVTNGTASGAYQYASPGSLGATGATVQWRADVSTVTPAGPTNGDGSYQAGATGSPNWTTPGEIEDYAFTVADAVYRPAARTTGGTGTFTVAGATLTAGTALVVGPAAGAAADAPVTLSATAPSGWNVAAVTIRDTGTGDVVATPTLTTTGSTSTFTYTPALASDVVIEAVYVGTPDPAQSTLTLDKDSTPVGTYVTATATIKDQGGHPLDKVPVTFANASAPLTTLTADGGGQTCVTDTSGSCSVRVTSWKAQRFVDEVSAQVAVDGVSRNIAQSPATVTFTAGGFSATASTFAVTPVADLGDPGTWVTADGESAYTGTLVARDAGGNPLPGLSLADMVFAATSPVAVTGLTDAGDGTYTVRLTSTVAAATPVVAAAYEGEPVGTAQPVPFRAGEPVAGPVICADGRPGPNLTVAPATVAVGEPSTAKALITDKLCNPVPDVSVVFAADGATVVSAAAATTG
ncbi:MAG: hypothetical protein LBI33_00690, partial [Propionibacteriaceae bacterium]|nr:hypothetical protein [Propionibacteriaceae bacterium]